MLGGVKGPALARNDSRIDSDGRISPRSATAYPCRPFTVSPRPPPRCVMRRRVPWGGTKSPSGTRQAHGPCSDSHARGEGARALLRSLLFAPRVTLGVMPLAALASCVRYRAVPLSSRATLQAPAARRLDDPSHASTAIAARSWRPSLVAPRRWDASRACRRALSRRWRPRLLDRNRPWRTPPRPLRATSRLADQ
jgi:hypothetical protein